MTKVLIANAYFYKLDRKQWRFKQPYPPLGTLLSASVLLEKKFDVSFFDTNLRSGPREIVSTINEIRPTYFVLYDDGFNYLTKMCLTVMREAAFTMIREAKKMNCKVIVSSSDATDHYEKYFDQGADYVIRGEGEETLADLLTMLEKKEKPSTVFGIAYREHNKVVVTAPRAVIRDLDALPLPAWDLADIDTYRKIWKKHHGYFSLNLATTRGCPFKCNWCAKPIYGNRYNSRSPQRVVDEIEYLLEHYKPDHFWMSDDIFGLKPGWLQSFRDEVVKRQLSFRYKIQSRADLLLEEDAIDALAQSGAETVWIGAESGSQKILDAMDKGTTVGQIKNATALLKQKKIRVAFFLQFGYLSETKDDIDATLQMVLTNMPHEIGISVSYPLPGTVFYNNVKSMLVEKQNWSDSDDLAMMYKSTFDTTYYKKLCRYVHNRYRIQRGVEQLRTWTRQPFIPSISMYKNIASMVYNFFPLCIRAVQLTMLSRLAVEKKTK